MSGHSGFSALSFLLGGSPYPCGTWFFAKGHHLPIRLREKARNVVLVRESTDGGVVVYPRSASRRTSVPHDRHEGHVCEVIDNHDTVADSYTSHPCHVNKGGWVDVNTPITLNLDDVAGCRMCVEDETSPFLQLLEAQPR